MNQDETLVRGAQNRDDMAYSYCMEMVRRGLSADYKALNQAIIDRWSKGGLAYVKRLAWKRFEQLRNWR